MTEQGQTITEQLQAHRGAMRLSRLAEVLGISYKTAYKWVTSCNLPAIKIAGTYWVDPQLAARWWSEHLTPTKPPARKGANKVSNVA